MRKKRNKSKKLNFLAVDGIELESDELSMNDLYKLAKKIAKEFGSDFKKENPPYYMG